MVDINNADALSMYATQVVEQQRANVPENYPKDYPYFPLKGEQGNPLTVQAGEERLSAWLERNEDEVFDKIVFKNEAQVNEIYSSRPDAKPDVEGGQVKWTESTGRQIYTNNEGIKIDADAVTKVSFNVKTGEIVDEGDAFDANFEAVDRGDEKLYANVLVPNELIIDDNNVSKDDLTHSFSLREFELEDEKVEKHSADSLKKIDAEKFLIDEIGNSLDHLRNYNVAPQIIISDVNVILNTDNVSIQQKAENVPVASVTSPKMDAGYAAAAKAAAAAPNPMDGLWEKFNEHAAAINAAKAAPVVTAKPVEPVVNQEHKAEVQAEEEERLISTREVLKSYDNDEALAARLKNFRVKLTDGQIEDIINSAREEIQGEMGNINARLEEIQSGVNEVTDDIPLSAKVGYRMFEGESVDNMVNSSIAEGVKRAAENTEKQIEGIPQQIQSGIDRLLEKYAIDPDLAQAERDKAIATMENNLSDTMQQHVDNTNGTISKDAYEKQCEGIERDFPDVTCSAYAPK